MTKRKPKRNEDGRLSLLTLEGKRIARIVVNPNTARLARYLALDKDGCVLFSFGPYDLADAEGMYYHNEDVPRDGGSTSRSELLLDRG